MTRKSAGNKPVNFEDYRSLAVNHVMTESNGKIEKRGSILDATCNFDYLQERFTLRLVSKQFLMLPRSLVINYRKQTIQNVNLLLNYTNDVTAMIPFRNRPIDFFGFDKNRTFSIEFMFDLCDGTKVKALYFITLPVVKQSSLHFKRPGMVMPNESIRTICEQEFKMGPQNDAAEIKIVIILEEFKLMSPVERYNIYGYVKMLNLFLDIENSFELDLLKKCNIASTKLQKQSVISFRINTFRQIPSAAAAVRLTPTLLVNSHVDKKELMEYQIHAPIVGAFAKYFVIEVNRGVVKKIDVKESYQVELCPNFYTNAMAKRALQVIEKEGYENFFLDFNECSLQNFRNPVFEQFDQIEWLNTNVGENLAQSQAIKHILNRTSFPSPYIVFGPPGTGKTSTLVEAVAQIVNMQPNAKVLVTVNSNSACDEIGERLMKYVGLNKMYRFYSPSFAKKMDRVNQKLKNCSNLRYGYHIDPSMQELMSYNVIIATLVNSGRLKALGPRQFDYIFIDECASSAEPFVTIPMSISLKKDVPIKTSFVLLGDPKQLGQIMRTHHSERYGFNISLMERVMQMNRYKFSYNGFDPRYIVQLTDNFRSHVSILKFSNKQFYNSILNAKQNENVANFAIGWEMLPNKDFPILFHASWTPSQNDDTSLFNDGDIHFVQKYVTSLLKKGINGKRVNAKDIGIVCPYAAQREKLKALYPQGVEIGTVEYFQGREKLVIILSTVRSKTPTVGFLKNEKRLNVALTRAKALLIVIGNPETLGKNKFWRKFIKMCVVNKAVVGKVPSWVYRKGETKLEEEDESDDVLRLEEMMNEMGLEE